MSKTPHTPFLKYGIPSLAILVIVVQLFFVKTQRLSKWKGGGYGMYTETHYWNNQIHISGLSVDSLLKDHLEMKSTLGYLMLMPSRANLKKAAELVLKTTTKDSIHIQIWKPSINSKNGIYTRVLIDEIYIKNKEL
jgi:hypothetical protein